MKKIIIVLCIFLAIVFVFLFKKEVGIISPIPYKQEPKCLGYLWYKYDASRNDEIPGASIGKIYCLGIVLKK